MSHSITVRLFAQIREVAGFDSMSYDIPPEGVVLSDLLACLQQLPQLAVSLRGVRLMMAVNQTMVQGGHSVMPGDELALFPPVTGG